MRYDAMVGVMNHPKTKFISRQYLEYVSLHYLPVLLSIHFEGNAAYVIIYQLNKPTQIQTLTK